MPDEIKRPSSTNPTAGDERLSLDELRALGPLLSTAERLEALSALPRDLAEDYFFSLPPFDQLQLIQAMPATDRRSWLRLLEPDDAADLIQSSRSGDRDALLALIDDATAREVKALLAYKEDHAGGLMSPRFGRLRPEMTAQEAVAYLRQQSRQSVETLTYVYVLDPQQTLLGVISFRDLFTAAPEILVRDLMRSDVRTVPVSMDQEHVAAIFRETGLTVMPVIDEGGHIQGIVTLDDIARVMREENTEDMQKMGGTEALGEPYLRISFSRMVKKRAGWLSALFLGEMLTATAMGFFEKELDKAVVLALFVPLIISSGGNSGSQATSLVIRAMALGEIRLRDWFRVVRRELFAGLALGAVLGVIGFIRIALWHQLFGTYPEHHWLIGTTVSLALVGVVTFGTIAGSLLPFILRGLKFDPASASAPFVATLVDVTGLIIYFTTANIVMRGTLL